MSEQMIAILITVILTIIKYAIFDEEAKKTRLEFDPRGWIHLSFGFLLIVLGLWLPSNNWSISVYALVFLVIGTMFATYGVLILLPENATLAVLDWHFVVGSFLFGAAIWALINLLGVTLGPSWNIMWTQVSAAYESAWALSAHAIGVFLSGAGVYSLVVIIACIFGVFAGWNIFFRNSKLTK